MDNFFNSLLVQLFLSMIISWGLFSIIIGIIHEGVVQLISERGRFLRVQLSRVLQDSANKINWGSLIYTTSFIKLLTKEKNSPVPDISPELFARSLVKSIADSHLVATARHQFVQTPFYNDPQLNALKTAVTYLKQSDVIQLIGNTLEIAETKYKLPTTPGAFEEGKIFQAVLDDIEAWFNSLSDRLTTWYKKKTKMRLFWLGFICAVIFNVNSITLTKFFFVNPQAREGIISYYQQNQQVLDSMANRYDLAKIDSEAIRNNLSDTNKNKALVTVDTIKLRFKSAANYLKLDSLIAADNLPIGWSKSNIYRFNQSFLAKFEIDKNGASILPIPKTKPCGFWQWVQLIAYVATGAVISGFAGSLGAPFWFDALRKIFSFKKPS